MDDKNTALPARLQRPAAPRSRKPESRLPDTFSQAFLDAARRHLGLPRPVR